MNGTIIDLGKDFGRKEKAFSSIILVMVVVGFMALQMYHIVPPGHRGISITLGKVNPLELPEGITFKWPFIQRILDFPIMQLKADGRAPSFSSDLQNMTFNYTIMYRVPAKQVVNLFQQYTGEPYSTLIEPRVQEVIRL